MSEHRYLFEDQARHPGRILKAMLDEKGWTQDDLAKITGVRRQTCSYIISGKSGISPDMAFKLSAAFGNPASEWLRWDNEYQLSNLAPETDVSAVREMKALYEIAPIRDMERRGWIRTTESPKELKEELSAFFDCDPTTQTIHLPVAARRTLFLPWLNPAEVVWCFRAKQMAKGMLSNPFYPSSLDKAKSALRKLAVHPKESCRVSKVLADYGIRFVVIEPIPGAKIDGAALWDDVGPIIALSIRHDRIDGFWFTLMHELEHIKNQDPISVDCEMVNSTRGVAITLTNDIAEDRANVGAASALISSAELESFIRRVGPLYARERIIQFANRIRIHPGIIVGQLQNRKELGYSALREFLVKTRENVVSTALTDGWGHCIAPINI